MYDSIFDNLAWDIVPYIGILVKLVAETQKRFIIP
jgi:hypothetical protein